MDKVKTRRGVPLETLRALGGVAAGALLAACLRGCAPSACRAEVERQAWRAALERNIREGIYPDVPCREEEREDRSRFSYHHTERHTRRESEALDGWAARRGLRPVKEGMTATGQEDP